MGSVPRTGTKRSGLGVEVGMLTTVVEAMNK